MEGTRALFASIGAGAALVAAAALSLLVVSAVFAFGSWLSFDSRAGGQPALVFAGSSLPDAGTGAPTPMSTGAGRIVAPASAPQPARRNERRPAASGSRAVGAPPPAAPRVGSPGATAAPDLGAPAARHSSAARPAPPASPPPRTGDHVRTGGGSLSSTVQNAGTVLANATQPLAPPVSLAVQQVLNLAAEIVRRTTGGLGNTLAPLLPPKR